METNLIGFDTAIGRQKPENIIHKDAACPFCDTGSLTGIIATDGDMILLKNKYNVLENADQFVLIESHVHDADIPDYSPDQMHRLLRFAVKHWEAMEQSGKYAAVLFFKNHGPLSGGTISHPHMQLVGLPSFHAEAAFAAQEFIGLPVLSRDHAELNLSTYPRLGFIEFNVVPAADSSLDTVADFIQIAVDFLMHHFHARCQSYNLFFYHEQGLLRTKIMPRFATSPLFVGYGIRLRPNNLTDIARKVQEIYGPSGRLAHTSSLSNGT
jgi:ATP adenylyltransferase/5',5'''-P-1,P-4-tetraphosphate phosphorylase II